MGAMAELRLARPDDGHLHLRDGATLAAVLPHSARCFARAVVMPNLDPPVRSVAEAAAYRERILAARPAGSDFEPLLTLYLTPTTRPAEIQAAARLPWLCGVKLYPAGATTHSEAGVDSLERVRPVLEAMERCELPLLVHAESTDPACDIFEREAVFVERELAPLQERFPALRMVVEHISTAEAADFVRAAPAHVAASVTPQHLLLNRNALFGAGSRAGLQPHHYCLPVLKHERHRRAVLAAATSGSPKFFLGTDSAPHPRRAKQSDCGCAGIYSAATALELYAMAFESVGRLDRLEAFASHHMADFYGLPRSRERVRLVREPTPVPPPVVVGDDAIVPLFDGQTLPWRLAGGD